MYELPWDRTGMTHDALCEELKLKLFIENLSNFKNA